MDFGSLLLYSLLTSRYIFAKLISD